MTKETELDKAVVALKKVREDRYLVPSAMAHLDAALAHLAVHDLWLQELLTTKTIEDAAVKHHKV